jgi:hypothetical protein
MKRIPKEDSMKYRRLVSALILSVLCLAAASPALGLANRVFASARSGNDANACDNVNTPCRTFAGAVTQVNIGGEVIVLDSGGYGPVTITHSLTIEAPAGVTAFIHPPDLFGEAITIDAASSQVTLRGLVLNAGANNGILVNSVGVLNVENCFITGFPNGGITMLSAGQLNVKGTDVTACGSGIQVFNASGLVRVSLDHCHLDGNVFGYNSEAASPGSSTTAATYTTANNNSQYGWLWGNGGGIETLSLEFCSGSGNGKDGLYAGSTNASSSARYSNCVFANNTGFGVTRGGSVTVESRGNNTITGNGIAPTFGTIGTFPAM